MSSVSGISSNTSVYDPQAVAARVPQKVLGQNDFLKLLAVQFQAQDPMKPREDTAFIAQMAQFASLEQSGAVAKEMAELRADQQRVTANSYLGHRVTIDLGDDQTVTGDVSAVDVSTGKPRLIVGDQSYSISDVLRVEPALVSTPAPQTAPAVGA